jgi:hypothetical protein
VPANVNNRSNDSAVISCDCPWFQNGATDEKAFDKNPANWNNACSCLISVARQQGRNQRDFGLH